MNPQPDPIVGHVFATLFVIVLIIHTINAIKNNKTFKLDDNYILGYIEDSPRISSIAVQTKKQSIESSQLYIDCVDALVALGMKKTEAKKKTKNIFCTNPPKTVQDFLFEALSVKS